MGIRGGGVPWHCEKGVLHLRNNVQRGRRWLWWHVERDGEGEICWCCALMMILVMMMTILKVIMKDNGTLPLPSKPTRAQTGSQARPKCVLGKFFFWQTREARQRRELVDTRHLHIWHILSSWEADRPDVLIVNIRPLNSLATSLYTLWCQALMS